MAQLRQQRGGDRHAGAVDRGGGVPARRRDGIALDIAATELWKDGGYRLERDDKTLGSDGLIAVLNDWIGRYPIVSIEDPLAEEDWEGMARFTARRERIQVVGDDLLVTNAKRVRRAIAEHACNAVLIKPNQAGTITETRTAFNAASGAGMATIVSARSGETEDTTIVHLAVGWGAGQIKVGSFARSERMAKWNEGLRIAEKLGKAEFAGRGVLARRRAGMGQ